MELDDAILHLEESLSDEKKEWSCESCKQEHVQLLNWLKDYKSLIKRPKAEWVYERGTVNSFFRCSNCGRFNPHDIFVKEDDDRYTKLEREDANRFCWHCGADMR